MLSETKHALYEYLVENVNPEVGNVFVWKTDAYLVFDTNDTLTNHVIPSMVEQFTKDPNISHEYWGFSDFKMTFSKTNLRARLAIRTTFLNPLLTAVWQDIPGEWEEHGIEFGIRD